METIVERPAALDVHKEQVTACVRVPAGRGRREQHLAEFKTTVQGLLALRDWLKAHGATQVAMEASGVYWKGSARISVYRWVVRHCQGCGLRSGYAGLPSPASSCNRFAMSSWRAGSRARSV